jgi:hypothetical protein
MPLQWNTLLQSGYERHLDQDYDRSGHLLPVMIFIEQDLIPKEDKGAYNHV